MVKSYGNGNIEINSNKSNKNAIIDAYITQKKSTVSLKETKRMDSAHYPKIDPKLHSICIESHKMKIPKIDID